MKTPEYKRQVTEMTAKAEQEIAEMRDKIAEDIKSVMPEDMTKEKFLAEMSEMIYENRQKEEAQKQKKSLMYRLGKGIRKLF